MYKFYLQNGFTSYSLVLERHHASSRSFICTALSRTVGSINLNRNSVAGDFTGLNIEKKYKRIMNIKLLELLANIIFMIFICIY